MDSSESPREAAWMVNPAKTKAIAQGNRRNCTEGSKSPISRMTRFGAEGRDQKEERASSAEGQCAMANTCGDTDRKSNATFDRQASAMNSVTFLWSLPTHDDGARVHRTLAPAAGKAAVGVDDPADTAGARTR
jgi:hypothetical protein